MTKLRDFVTYMLQCYQMIELCNLVQFFFIFLFFFFEGKPMPSHNYQFQIQNMWQKCWNQNTAMLQGVRYRERGPMKSWRPETMAEAIWAVLQEGLSLSQAARKHDIPYPTFVLYANRVHNMLGPSLNGGSHNVGGGNMSLGTYYISKYLVRIRFNFKYLVLR